MDSDTLYFITPFAITGGIILAIVLTMLLVVQPYFTSHEYIDSQKKATVFYDGIRSTLSNPNITCKNLIALHVQNVQHKLPYPLVNDLLNELRDLYNAKNCGTHWGWWEN